MSIIEAILQHLLGHFAEKFISGPGVVVAMLIAFALYCFDTALQEVPRRARYSIPLFLAAAAIFAAVFVYGGLGTGDTLRITVAAAVIYLPWRFARRGAHAH